MSYLGRGSNLTRKAQDKVSFLATAGQTVRTGLSYVPTHVDVTVNGITLTEITDYTATNGNSITFSVALALNDEVTIVSSKTFDVANHYTISAANALLAAKATNTAVALKSPIASPVFTGNVGVGSALLTTTASNMLQLGSTSNLAWYNQNDDELDISVNAINNSGNKYIETKAASQYIQYAGTHIFKVAASGSAGAAITWNTGLEVVASGKARAKNGLLFGTDTAAANALDDYEEGTWTPAFGRNGGSQPTVGYSEQVGSYTKVGNMVFLTGDISISSISVPDNGNLTITGMPFTKGSAHNPTGSFTCSEFNFTRARSQLVHLDGTKLGFLGQAGATGAGAWNWEEVSSLSGNESFRFAITYQV